MINKIKKYLLKTLHVTEFKENSSGSTYYKVENVKIRVSDHFATSMCLPNTLNIVVNNDNFVVVYGNKPIAVNNYTELKNFLKYFTLMGSSMKSFIPKATKKKPKKAETKVVIKEIIKEIPISSELKTIDISDLSKKQRQKLREDVNAYWGSKGLLNVSGLTKKQINNLNKKIKKFKEDK